MSELLAVSGSVETKSSGGGAYATGIWTAVAAATHS